MFAIQYFQVILIGSFLLMSKPTIRETELYLPVKALLEGQGYEVKAEIGSADVVAIKENEPPVIVELKIAFSLALFHQAIERLAISDIVYVAVPRGAGKPFFKSLKNNIRLCRRLGIGLITVRMKDGFTEIHVDPGPYAPRKSKVKSSRLLKEFAKRVGDPNLGGTGGQKLMTAYRQDALRCLKMLKRDGASKAAHVAKIAQVDRARNIMADDHYGWFEKGDGLGVYQITPNGKAALKEYASDLKLIKLLTKA